MKSIS
jgi:hypothetical protein